MAWLTIARSDPVHRLDRLDRTILVVIVILVGAVVAATVPGVVVRITAPGLDIAFDTVTTLAALAVAVLAWVRYRDRGQWVALCESAAFLVLALANAIAAVMALWTLEGTVIAPVMPFSEATLYVSVIARIMAAALLVAAGARPPRRLRVDHPLALAALPALAVVAVALLLLAPPGASGLPPLVAAGPPSGAGTPALPAATLLNVALQVAGAVLFAAAAVPARLRARRDGAVSDRYLAVGLVVAAFAQLQLTVFPSAYAGVMTGGDLLYLAFDVILLLGIEAETRAHVVDLRRANVGLQRLREAEVERAAIEERARLSRELHDGLAQDLWLAKLLLGRLSATPGLSPEALAACGELGDAVDAGLAEARQAVMALRPVGDAGAPLLALMAQTVDDFADRFGLRTEFTCPEDIPPLGTRVEAELLRIVQEALSNARRHADATVIRVQAAIRDGRLVLTVRDNGRGFDPASAGGAGFGLVSMRERAALVGGRLTISSRPSDGTTVTLEIGLPGGGAAGMVAP